MRKAYIGLGTTIQQIESVAQIAAGTNRMVCQMAT